MTRLTDNPMTLATDALITNAKVVGQERGDQWILALASRLETYLEDAKRDRIKHNEFKRELTSLMGML